MGSLVEPIDINSTASAASWLAQTEAAWRAHQAECLAQIAAARADLERLQGLVDDTLRQVAQTFEHVGVPASDAERDALIVMALQHQDICGQLAQHLASRLEQAADLAATLVPPLTLALAGASGNGAARATIASQIAQLAAQRTQAHAANHPGPVRNERVAAGDIELF